MPKSCFPVFDQIKYSDTVSSSELQPIRNDRAALTCTNFHNNLEIANEKKYKTWLAYRE
jgi:hypothetical protein